MPWPAFSELVSEANGFLVPAVVGDVVRSRVALMGSEEDLVSLQKDEYNVNFKEVDVKIDGAFGFDWLMETS